MKFHSEHCWVETESDRARIGISNFAKDELGEIIYVDLPQVGDRLTQGEQYAEVESTKTTSDVIAPVSGRVVEVNSGLEDDISPLNESPQGAGWLCRVVLDNPAELDGLMDEAAYLESVGTAEEG